MDTSLHTLRDCPVVVTGATGFIGGALARRLRAEGAAVTAAVRSPDKTDFDAVKFDLGDPTSFAAAVAGQRIVFHVAAWMGGEEAEAETFNVEATRALVAAALSAGVERFVLISTVAVYGLPEADRVTEEHAFDLQQSDPYGRTKAIGELAARELGGDRVVVIRPAMVYGPSSWTWTVTMMKMVKKGTPSIFGAGDGLTFLVYIDNLVDAILAGATTPEAAGQAFHLADTSLPWADFFGIYGKMCGRPPRRVPDFVASAIALAAELLPLGIPLTRGRLAMYRKKLVFDTTKAQRVLGWTPRIDLEEGMRRSETWLREAGHLP